VLLQKEQEGAPLKGAEAELSTAVNSAYAAWQRASSLAAAAGWTLLDAARMLIIATAQK
jgi:hypothetical protein